ncbi:thioredoxin [Thiohalobacter sp. COW1]|uniref:Thiol-disulfide isomerase and thioredoxins n=1 Tax=Thiohalobacter thiocyanaticus TaxID=585455 RepID=A0A1Z4VP22_9GAMM|nr:MULTISPECIES: TlpA disulfide reductase family protein [Thiohalobacter]BAZ93088.1 thiol-disulfide isomerase and thioredoxins [Thiohalobacter thiocyanaticus]BCO31901.1 thioredoxin [Thiohalobacter sp. COW1]
MLARLLLSIALLAFAPAAPADLGHDLTRLPEPVPAPDFALEDMDGEIHRLSDLRGRVVMVNFWATWCPPCREEMPSMEAVYQGLKDEGFQVLAVNQWESPDQVFPYMGQLDVYPSFPVLFDRDSSVAEAYGVKGLPTTVLIDPQGRVVYRAVGGRNFNHAEVRALIRGLMEHEE